MELTKQDNLLIQEATELIKKLYKPGKQHVAAALQSKSGKIYSAVNIDTYVGRAGVCAEPIVLGKMISDGETEFATIVAVYQPNPKYGQQEPYAASPCGVCREMLADYCPEAMVIYMDKDKITKGKVSDLLPGKFAKKHLPRQ